MKNWFFIACVLMMGISCSKEYVGVSEELPAVVQLNVSVPIGGMTKVTDIITENSVNSLQVFVFRSDGRLEAYKTVNGASNLTFDCTVGTKKVAALVNAPAITDIKTLAELEKKTSMLDDNAPGALVMYGKKDASITSADAAVTVPVTRLVARVSVSRITNKIELEQYRQAKMELSRIYLVNVAGSVDYGLTAAPTVWYNKSVCAGQGDLSALLFSGDLAKTEIAYGTSYATTHYMYCYPNSTPDNSGTDGPGLWSPKPTRVVVEILIDGKLYYYPVTVKDIKSNCTYNITDLVITRLGSESPDAPVTMEAASFTVEIQPWVSGFNESVTI